jgi:hypothetical protein
MEKLKGIANLVDLEKVLRGEEYEGSYDNCSIYYVTEPIECILIDPDGLRPFRKAPEITLSLILNDVKLLELIHNKYVPVINKNTKELMFTEEEYYRLRTKVSGISEYNGGDFIFSDNLYFEGIEYYLDRIDENNREIESFRNPVIVHLTNILSNHGLTVSVGCNSGGDVELVEAGSTARYTNVPSTEKSKCDLDFTVRFNPELTWKVKEILENDLEAGSHITRTSRYKVRLTDVTIPGLEDKIDLDFSLTPQRDRYLSTEDALSQRLDNMKVQDYERYRMVVANIMYAKDLLKKSGAYKPARGILEGDRANGGLGGVGIENWILQNGGSFIDAARDFFSVAEGRDFLEFEQEYFLMDFGCNHVGKSKCEWPYDNFVVNNMRYLGYEKMRDVLREFLKRIPNETISK